MESDTFYVVKGQPPQEVGTFYLDDPDDWKMGHGPPFTFQIDPKATKKVRDSVDVTFNPSK